MLKAKVVKEAQMKELERTFQDYRDLVLLPPLGIEATAENELRLGLRQQDIRLMLVKNNLAKVVLTQRLDMIIDEKVWEGPTLIAWGSTSLKSLSKSIEKTIKTLNDSKKDPHKIEAKGAVADGTYVPFEDALKMPTREEVIGQLVSMMMGPAMNLSAAITGPGKSLAAAVVGPSGTTANLLAAVEAKRKEEGGE
ncbi:MAG: 50S ribosomal protein L10 [Gemmataceae bacterium]